MSPLRFGTPTRFRAGPVFRRRGRAIDGHGYGFIRAALILGAALAYHGSVLKLRFRGFGLELAGLATCSCFAALCDT